MDSDELAQAYRRLTYEVLQICREGNKNNDAARRAVAFADSRLSELKPARNNSPESPDISHAVMRLARVLLVLDEKIELPVEAKVRIEFYQPMAEIYWPDFNIVP